jgi:AraC-like DNA-binding protein
MTVAASKNRRQIERAYHMLKNLILANHSIASIAFDDLSYFSRAFKRRYGATPSEVRNAVDR